MTDAQGALVYTMVVASACDGGMSDRELDRLGEMIRFLPVFETFDPTRIGPLTDDCIAAMQDEEGLDGLLDQILASLPEHLRETAYAIACDVVAADGSASQVELRFLEMLRHQLMVDRLTAAAIERGARARSQRLES